MVSPAIHDGTPNTLLESMASGVLPVVGDLDSIREWVRDGENGLLVNPRDPRAVAQGIVRGLKDRKLRLAAAKMNSELIAERADYETNMVLAENFYQQLVD
jgi:glycosyltransferase involved in cell wall biosynthesis